MLPCLFTEDAKIVLNCGEFYKKIKEEGDRDARVISKSDRQYFTEEEWDKIITFFQKIKPLDIMKYQNVSTNGIRIDFPMNDEEKHVDLYYIDLSDLDDEIEDARSQLSGYDAFRRIGEHWWLGP